MSKWTEYKKQFTWINNIAEIPCTTCGIIHHLKRQTLSGNVYRWYKHHKTPYHYRCYSCTRAIQLFWKGGKSINGDGYVLIHKTLIPKEYHTMLCTPQYALEHRIIAAMNLKTVLPSTTIVHHRNGNRQDNRKENLDVTDPSTHIAITRMESVWENKIKNLEQEVNSLKQQLIKENKHD